jgi:hypothetical protein
MAYTAMSGLLSTASAATAVATDPSLPVVVDLVLKLQKIEKDKAASAAPGAPSTVSFSTSNFFAVPSRGVGLRNVVGPLKMFVAIQERPWILPVTVVGILGVTFMGGYLVGKRRKR